MTSSPSVRKLTTVLLLTVIYLIAGKLGLRLAFVNPSATAVWAPTGIALAALLVLGHQVWPGIFFGAFLVNIATAGSLGWCRHVEPTYSAKKGFLADGTDSHKTFVEAFPLLLGFRDYLVRSQGTDRLLLRIVCQSTTFGTNAELTP